MKTYQIYAYCICYCCSCTEQQWVILPCNLAVTSKNDRLSEIMGLQVKQSVTVGTEWDLAKLLQA